MHLQPIHLGMTPWQMLIYRDYHGKTGSGAFWGPNSTKKGEHKRKPRGKWSSHYQGSIRRLQQQPGHTNTSFSLSSSSSLHFSGTATSRELFSSQIKSSRFLARLVGFEISAGCEGQKRGKREVRQQERGDRDPLRHGAAAGF